MLERARRPPCRPRLATREDDAQAWRWKRVFCCAHACTGEEPAPGTSGVDTDIGNSARAARHAGASRESGPRGGEGLARRQKTHVAQGPGYCVKKLREQRWLWGYE